jgi:hypothetical protein
MIGKQIKVSSAIVSESSQGKRAKEDDWQTD